jgi:hypothetical protein
MPRSSVQFQPVLVSQRKSKKLLAVIGYEIISSKDIRQRLDRTMEKRMSEVTKHSM